MNFTVVSDDYFENVKKRDEHEILLKKFNQFLSLGIELHTYGFFDLNELPEINSYIKSHTNQLKILNGSITAVENDARKFSLCVLFNRKKKVYINRRINPEKDFCDYYQSVGGELEEFELYEKCAKRETEEEAGVEIQSMSFVAMDKYIDEKTKTLFKCAIYIGYIGDQIPQNKEPNKHSDWQLVHLQNLNTYKLTDSLVKYVELIKSAIVDFKISNKRRRVDDIDIKLENEIEESININQNVKTEDIVVNALETELINY